MTKPMIIMMGYLLMICSAAQAEPELKGTPGELTKYLADIPPAVSIVGEGELKVYADQAEVKILVTVEEKTLKKSLEKYQELCVKITKMLTEKGVPADKIVPAKFMTTQDKSWLTSKTSSYRLTNSIRVSVTSQAALEQVAVVVDSIEGVTLGDIEFSHSQEEQMKRQVLAKACEDINAKKEIYEKNFNIKLKPRGFIEMPVVSARQPEMMMLSQAKEMSSVYEAMPEAKFMSYVQKNVQFDEMVFKCHLSATFQMLP